MDDSWTFLCQETNARGERERDTANLRPQIHAQYISKFKLNSLRNSDLKSLKTLGLSNPLILSRTIELQKNINIKNLTLILCNATFWIQAFKIIYCESKIYMCRILRYSLNLFVHKQAWSFIFEIVHVGELWSWIEITNQIEIEECSQRLQF